VSRFVSAFGEWSATERSSVAKFAREIDCFETIHPLVLMAESNPHVLSDNGF
jgi:hypothetical protein